MLDFLRRLANGEVVPSPAVVPLGFRGATLPDVDDIAPAPEGASIAPSELAGRGFVIVYTDAAGARSERRIICRNVYTAEGRRYLEATCLERHAPRCFRVDRIEEAYCGITGEELGAPLAVFAAMEHRVVGPRFSRTNPVPEGRDPERLYWYERVRAASRVLMAIARCDGRVHDNEDTRILAFIGEMAARHDLPAYQIAGWARRLAPDFDTFMDAFALVCTEPKFTLEVVQTAIDVAAADGRWRDEEVNLIEDLGRIGASCGVNVPLERVVIETTEDAFDR